MSVELETLLLGIIELVHTSSDSLLTIVIEVLCKLVDCDVLITLLMLSWCNSWAASLSSLDSWLDNVTGGGGCFDKSSTRLFNSLMCLMFLHCDVSFLMCLKFNALLACSTH